MREIAWQVVAPRRSRLAAVTKHRSSEPGASTLKSTRRRAEIKLVLAELERDVLTWRGARVDLRRRGKSRTSGRCDRSLEAERALVPTTPSPGAILARSQRFGRRRGASASSTPERFVHCQPLVR